MRKNKRYKSGHYDEPFYLKKSVCVCAHTYIMAEYLSFIFLVNNVCFKFIGKLFMLSTIVKETSPIMDFSQRFQVEYATPQK